MTKEMFEGYIVELVVKNSTPLVAFSSHAMQGLLGELSTKLGVQLSRQNVRNMVMLEAKKHKELLVNQLKDKPIFLKMDACTRHRVNYFAVNILFISDEKEIITRTLAVKDTEARQTSEFVKKLVYSTLEDFKLTRRQIIAIVTDNASNMVSTLEKINEENEETTSEEGDQDDSSMSELFHVHHMRCAVHTLQLAVRDGLKNKHAATLVSKIRSVAVDARTPKLDAIVKRRCGKGAIMDQATRWGSTYQMIERLLELQPALMDMAYPEVTLTDAQWNQLKELKGVLEHPYIATKNLQQANLTPGEFMKEWKGLLFKLSNQQGIIAEEIISSMKNRDNYILIAAVYVDPKYRVKLTENQIAKAKVSL
jgi:hypothetical protein